MNTIVPITIILSLGAGSGLILRRWFSNVLITSILAGIVGTFLWGIGMEVLFRMADFEEERGSAQSRQVLKGILIVFLVAFIASLVALTYQSINRKRNTNMSMQETSQSLRDFRIS